MPANTADASATTNGVTSDAELAGVRALKIGGLRYTVDMAWSLVDAEMDEAEGDISFLRSRIRVADMPSVNHKCERLIHEILHGLIYDSALSMDEDDEEDVVAHVSPRLTAFMADNPEAIVTILRVLTGRDVVIADAAPEWSDA